ncbi:unnamed protein product [Staurois parvus]|uniref:Uncharacterized protein n=1 Tax=Staurois parvus TaxID=386267 RepID=A0ABN9EZA1_9NEOB|nr:unnamed protein product [Staurois parvus]
MSCQSAPVPRYNRYTLWACIYSLNCTGPGSVGGPMRCPWYLFHRLF